MQLDVLHEHDAPPPPGACGLFQQPQTTQLMQTFPLPEPVYECGAGGHLVQLLAHLGFSAVACMEYRKEMRVCKFTGLLIKKDPQLIHDQKKMIMYK